MNNYDNLVVFNFGKRVFNVMKNNDKVIYFENVNGSFVKPIVSFNLYDNEGKALSLVNQHFFMSELVSRVNIACKKGFFINNQEIIDYLNNIKSDAENNSNLKQLFKGSLMKEINEFNFEKNKRGITSYLDGFKYDSFNDFENVSIFSGSLEKNDNSSDDVSEVDFLKKDNVSNDSNINENSNSSENKVKSSKDDIVSNESNNEKNNSSVSDDNKPVNNIDFNFDSSIYNTSNSEVAVSNLSTDASKEVAVSNLGSNDINEFSVSSTPVSNDIEFGSNNMNEVALNNAGSSVSNEVAISNLSADSSREVAVSNLESSNNIVNSNNGDSSTQSFDEIYGNKSNSVVTNNTNSSQDSADSYTQSFDDIYGTKGEFVKSSSTDVSTGVNINMSDFNDFYGINNSFQDGVNLGVDSQTSNLEFGQGISSTVEPVQSSPVTPSVSPVVEPVQSNPVTPSVSPAVEPVQSSPVTPSVSPSVEPVQSSPVTPSVSPAVEPVQSNPVTPSVSPAVEPVQSNPVTPSVSPVVEQPVVSNDFGFGEVAQSSGVNLDYLNSQDGNNMSYIDQVKSRIQNSSVKENASNYSSVDVNSQSVSVPVNMEVSSTNTIPSPTVAPDLLSAQLEPVEEKTVVKKKKSNIGLIIFIVILILILIGFGFYLYNVVF